MKKISTVILLTALAPHCFAIDSSKEVVGVYDIVTEDNKWKADLGFSYTTQSQDLVEGAVCTLLSEVDSVDLPGLTVPACLDFGTNAPVSVISRSVNVDRFTLSGNLRRRIGKKLQLFTFLSGDYIISRDTINATGSPARAFSTDEKATFSNLGIGLSYELKQETTTPAVILSASMPIITREQSILGDYFQSTTKNLKLSVNTVFTVDPLVFSLTASYRANRKVKGNNKYATKAGDTFSLAPVFYFAVNPYTTLNFGYTFSYTGDSRIGFEDGGTRAGIDFDYQTVTKGVTRGSFQFGMQYEIARKYVMSLDVLTSNTSNSSTSSLSFGLTIDF